LAASWLAPSDEREKSAARAIEIARAEHAPDGVLLGLELAQASLSQREEDGGVAAPALARLTARAEADGDPTTATVFRLMMAEREDDPAKAQTYLRAVIDDRRLAAKDPLRIGAMVRLAAAQAQMNRLDLARATYAETGLSAEQCALVDAQPDMKASGMSSTIYPTAAVLWRTTGWSSAEFDITAAGETVNRRTVVAYPPFVFGPAVIKGLEKARYTQSYRPEGSLGCGGAGMRVRFTLPDR
jgi:hypothetical protein